MKENYSNTAILKKLLESEFVNVQNSFKVNKRYVSSLFNAPIILSVNIVSYCKGFVASVSLAKSKVFNLLTYLFQSFFVADIHKANRLKNNSCFYGIYTSFLRSQLDKIGMDTRLINYFVKTFLLFCVAMCLFVTESRAQFSGGAGTADNPYQIASLDDLILLSESPEYWDYITYFIQTADIDASSTDTLNGGLGFKPIGTGYAVNEQSFSGFYNGNGHIIYNLYINRPYQDNVGLFGATSNGGHLDTIIIVRNLKLIGVQVVGNDHVGGLVGANAGRIINCFVSGSVTGNNVVGGITDFSRGVIDCRSEANIVGNNDVGGLVGIISTSLIGHTIINSSASGDVIGKNNVGGLAGGNMLALGMENLVCFSFATGNVTGEENIGGIVGQNKAELSECYATGDVSGVKNVGGLIGYNERKISNCYSMGRVVGSINIGGVIGYEMGIITTCYSTSEVTGDSNVGGFAGLAHIGITENSGFYNNANIDRSAATGLSLSEMQAESNFHGFNFDTVWAIHPLINCGYPYLQALPPDATDTITSTTDNSRCGQGVLTLQASAQSGELNWYDAEIKGSVLYTGENFATPFLDSSALFWVELHHGICALPRQAVAATLFILDNHVEKVAETLFAKQDNVQYQWLDCNDNFNPISGAVMQFFIPAAAGSYAVEITQNACIDTSACVGFTGNVSISSKHHLFSVYPNPATTELTIEVLEQGGYSYEITGIAGNLITSGNLQADVNTIDISRMSAGMYLVHVLIDNNRITTYKFIKQTE